MIDLELVSQNIDIEDFLFTKLGVKCLGNSGSNYIIMCPDPTHMDKHPSCYFHKEKLVYHCFGCNAKGNLTDLIVYVRDIDHSEAEKLIYTYSGLAVESIVSTFKQRYEKYKMKQIRLNTQYNRNWEDANDEILRFVKKKNYNLDLFRKFYIGFNNHIGSVTFPIIYGNRVINVGERYVVDTGMSKIKYRKGVPLSLSVWGIFDDHNPVNPYFTEGIADAVRMREAGYNAYALLSIVLPNIKMRFLLNHFEGDFTIVPDPDHGGDKMIDNWKKCQHYTSVNVLRPKYDDIDATPIDEIHELVKNTVSIKEYMREREILTEEVCENINER